MTTGFYGNGMIPNSQMLMQNYASNVGIADMMNGDICAAGMMGMNGSIWGGGFYGTSQKEYNELNNKTSGEKAAYFTQQNEMATTEAFNSNARIAHSQTAPNDVIAKVSGHLNELIKENRQDEIGDVYPELRNAVKEKFETQGITLSEEDLETQTQAAYYQVTQTRITDDLKKYGDSGITHGLKRGVLFGLGSHFTQKTTSADNLETIAGIKRTEGDKIADEVGNVVSLVATGALAVFLTPKVLKGVGTGGWALLKSTGNSWKSLFSKESYKSLAKVKV